MVAQLNCRFTIQPICPWVFFCPVQWTQCLIFSFRSAPIAAISKSQILWSCVVMCFPDNLETLGRFSCSTVKNLNVTGCRSFTQSAFSNILELATGLQDLRCGGCERLERIHIPQASLLHLEVSGCSSLRRSVFFLSTHALNTAQHWLNMPVIFADCVVYWLHLALLDITDIVLLAGYCSRELAILLCLSVVTGISVGWISDM